MCSLFFKFAASLLTATELAIIYPKLEGFFANRSVTIFDLGLYIFGSLLLTVRINAMHGTVIYIFMHRVSITTAVV